MLIARVKQNEKRLKAIGATLANYQIKETIYGGQIDKDVEMKEHQEVLYFIQFLAITN